jgi:hypothetical protein
MASKKTKNAEIEAIESVTAVMETMDSVVEALQFINESIEVVKQRGRKVNPDSARQHRLGLKTALIEAGVEIQRGRKIDPNSPRQQRLAALNEKRASGAYAGRGRPKKVTVEAVMTELNSLEVE